jgi:hypothetical protein
LGVRARGAGVIGQKDYDQACALFRSFQGRDPARKEILIVKPAAATGALALVVGQCVSIGYRALGDGKDYYHEFGGRLPMLCVTGDGKQLFYVGGSYTFTDRGFIR